jgi:uncharacterized integral membrane protein
MVKKKSMRKKRMAMPNKLKNKVGLILVLIFVFSTLNVVQSKITVGVKEGDWIEYVVTTTGNPSEEFNVSWARMEILTVQGTQISANVTTKAGNGTLSKGLVMNFDIAKGRVGAWFIVPVDLNVGDCFYDESMNRDVEIEGEEQLTFAGATRTITNASTDERLKRWDKSTGVFVECIDNLADFSINATAVRTNMWNPEVSGWNPTIIYMLGIVVLGAVLFIAILVWKVKS